MHFVNTYYLFPFINKNPTLQTRIHINICVFNFSYINKILNNKSPVELHQIIRTYNNYVTRFPRNTLFILSATATAPVSRLLCSICHPTNEMVSVWPPWPRRSVCRPTNESELFSAGNCLVWAAHFRNLGAGKAPSDHPANSTDRTAFQPAGHPDEDPWALSRCSRSRIVHWWQDRMCCSGVRICRTVCEWFGSAGVG